MFKYEQPNKCPDHEIHCFANNGKGCMALVRTNFNGRPCPFYKSKEQRARELAALERRRAHG